MYYTTLRNHREENGLSQQQLSLYLGLKSRNAYALKEKGQRRFSVEEGLRLAKLFDTSVETLFSGHTVTEMVTESDEQ